MRSGPHRLDQRLPLTNTPPVFCHAANSRPSQFRVNQIDGVSMEINWSKILKMIPPRLQKGGYWCADVDKNHIDTGRKLV